MALRPGEENVATLFGDVHYYYAPPTESPVHHRFDKGSYVYLFENLTEKRTRLEIANQPGTERQDAFSGYLDRIHVRYSHKQQCLVSLLVGQVDRHDEWHLPTYNIRNEQKYHYKLHSLDIYLWTHADALHFIGALQRLLPSSLLEIRDEPRQPMQANPLIQKLEEVALSDPGSSIEASGRIDGSPSMALTDIPLPPPPPFPSKSTEPSIGFAPMAYNPAAPAPPETVRPREKTPPLPEDDTLDPRHIAAAQEVHQSFPSSQSMVPHQPFHGNNCLPAHTTPASPLSAQNPYFPVTPSFLPQPSQALQSPGIVSPPATKVDLAPTLPPPPPTIGPPQQNVPYQPDHSKQQLAYRPNDGDAYQQKKPETLSKLQENAGRLERGVSGMFKKFEKKFG